MTEKNEILGDQEDPKELARALLLEGASVEAIMSKTTLSKPAILGLKGVLVKAQKRLVQASKPAYKQANRTEANSKLQTQIEAQDEPNIDLDGEVNSPASPSNLDEKPKYIVRDGSPFIHIDTASAIAFRESLPNPQKKLFDGYLALGQKSWKDQIQSHDGHGSTGYELNDPVKEAKARIYTVYADWMEQQAIESMAEKMRNPKGHTDTTNELDQGKVFSQVTTAIGKAIETGVNIAPKGGGLDAVSLVQLMNQTRAEARADLQSVSRANMDNINSVKIKEMDGVEKLEVKKIDFELMKWQDGKESEKQLYNLVGQVVGADGIVGKIAQTLGEAAKTRLERGGQKSNNPNAEGLDPTKIKTIACPNCAKPIRIIEGTKIVPCSSCDAVLRLQEGPPQPQAMPQPQTETETRQEQPTEEQKQEGKPMSLPTKIGESDF